MLDIKALLWYNIYIETLKERSGNVYECFHCGQRSVYWQNDFTFEDYGYEGEGIVHVCHCGNCGADIEYYVPYDNDDDNTNDNKEIEWKTTQKKNLNKESVNKRTLLLFQSFL